MNAYEQKQAARKARLERAAATAGASAAALSKRASAIASMIPLGQPILVGHHSERRHRRDAARITGLHTKAYEARTEAADLARRAAAVGTAGISSDDPDAIAKLEAELAQEQQKQTWAKTINAALRKNAKAGPDAQVAALVAIGFREAEARGMVAPDDFGRVGVPAYVLTNRGANIRRIEKRIAELRAKAAAPARAPITGDGYEIVEDRDANRVQIRFTARQTPEACKVLKGWGFRWAPSVEAWQRQASNGAWHAAQSAVAAIARAASAARGVAP